MESIPNRANEDAPAKRVGSDKHVSKSAFQFDEIGLWSELKLEISEKYASAYTTAFGKSTGLTKYHIDGFSGAGLHRSNATGAPIHGSPTRALNVTPPFDGYYFIDLDPEKTDYLKSTCGNRSDVQIFTGDCTQISQLRYCRKYGTKISTAPSGFWTLIGSILIGK
jgi:hypothetical protein